MKSIAAGQSNLRWSEDVSTSGVMRVLLKKLNKEK